MESTGLLHTLSSHNATVKVFKNSQQYKNANIDNIVLAIPLEMK